MPNLLFLIMAVIMFECARSSECGLVLWVGYEENTHVQKCFYQVGCAHLNRGPHSPETDHLYCVGVSTVSTGGVKSVSWAVSAGEQS